MFFNYSFSWGELHVFIVLLETCLFLFCLCRYRRKWFIFVYLVCIWPFSTTLFFTFSKRQTASKCIFVTANFGKLSKLCRPWSLFLNVWEGPSTPFWCCEALMSSVWKNLAQCLECHKHSINGRLLPFAYIL